MTVEAHCVERPGAVAAARPMAALSVLSLLRGTVLGPHEQHLGHIQDVVVSPGDRYGCTYPLVTGVVALLGTCEVFAPAGAIASWHRNRIVLAEDAQLRRVRIGTDDVSLAADILGRRLLTGRHHRPVRAHDLLLTRSPAGWCVSAVDVRSRRQRWSQTGRRDGLLDWTDIHNVREGAVRLEDVRAHGSNG